EPILDDLRFQRDLVDEAKRRIIRYCPEWTDYNVSDPGVTLIELFAWMTEMITYRLNLVPEKNYIRFMDLLGIKLQPANSARAEIFYAFARPRPRVGDTFYLGFDETNNISGHILRLSIQAEETQATGVRRNDPPLVWECSSGNGQWEEVAPSTQPEERDTTGGL